MMKIYTIVDRKCTCVSILEKTKIIVQLLKKHPYLAIVKENHEVFGIITVKDLQTNSECLPVIDWDIAKPKVIPDQTILETFKIMKDAETDFLPVYEDSQFIGVISLIAIIEKLVHVVAELQQNYQKVVHDLRNPIGNLQGLSNVLEETLPDTERHELLRLFNLSCQHAMEILDDLLVVEVDQNKVLKKLPTEMNNFYRQCINEQAGLSMVKKINIAINLSEEKIIKDIDRNSFKRAVQNVIANAIKFSYPRSTVKISSKIKEGMIILKILDTGIGIPEKLQPEVFKEFSSAKRAGTGGEPSTGLGLCFTKQCLERHNGNIYFKSTEGKGTKFYISI